MTAVLSTVTIFAGAEILSNAPESLVETFADRLLDEGIQNPAALIRELEAHGYHVERGQ